MKDSRFSGVIVSSLCAFAALALASPAAATITVSDITTPATSPTYVTYDNDSPATIVVAGTTNSTSPGTDRIDLRCFYGDSGQSYLLQSGVSLTGDGSFSAQAPLSNIERSICRLRAVPAGATVNQPAFSGPLIAVDYVATRRIAGGPNAGLPYDFYAWGQQTGAADDYNSVGNCGLADSFLYDDAYGYATTVFYCNAWMYQRNLDGAGDTRSEIQVDGQDAYDASGAAALFPRSGACPSACDGSIDDPGFPALSYTVSQDSSSGDVTISDSETIVRCPPGTSYPPSQTTCGSFTSTGVRVNRTIRQTSGGHLVLVTDSYQSTDGHAHALDLLYQNDQAVTADFASPLQADVGYRFPGQTRYQAHVRGNEVSVPRGLGTIYVKNLTADDGDPYTGQGAITYSTAPSEILFISPATEARSDFTMHYAGTVPARGSLIYAFAYSTDFTTAAVTGEARIALNRFGPPTVRITSPRTHITTHRERITVTGKTTPGRGLVSLTLNGVALPVAAGGEWTAWINLRPGHNRILVTATNYAGSSASASSSVTYEPLPCQVPDVAGERLAAARRALARGHCVLGRVIRRRARHVRPGRVISTVPRPGARRPGASQVEVIVSR